MEAITEDYISFEVAKLLKEKGFNERLFTFYTTNEAKKEGYFELMAFTDDKINNNHSDYCYLAPTLQMTMKWLREVHNIDIFPWKIGKGIYSCAIFNSNTGQDLSSNKDFPSEKYEETVEAAIKYCLENLI